MTETIEAAQDPRVEASPMDVWTESRPRIGHETLNSGKKVYFLSMDGADHHRLISAQCDVSEPADAGCGNHRDVRM